MRARRYLAALGLPGIVWVALFVATALYALIAISVGGLDPILLTPVPAWNPLHWSASTLQEVGTALKPFSGSDWMVFQRTVIYIAIALAGCILVGYPVAYYVAIRARRSKGIILALFVAPFLVSYMLRMLAWVGLLSPDGWINLVLEHLGLMSGHQPLNWLSGRSVTVVCALIYGWVPYFILPLYASLARFDQRFLEASRDLGAGTWQTFLHVTLPLSKQGILAGTVIVALPMFGDFFTNALVSGTASTAMVGSLINTYAQSQTDQGLAAAGAVWLMALLTLLLLPYLRSSARATAEVAR
ncbi:MAG TPA: ABC transporter permease [Solirubrobacteraceae bacterium]|jgi:spermidine/putrescine transport system permease protein|nr:ABC transporter permease [Solirubrobacteraceae bacterium]